MSNPGRDGGPGVQRASVFVLDDVMCRGLVAGSATIAGCRRDAQLTVDRGLRPAFACVQDHQAVPRARSGRGLRLQRTADCHMLHVRGSQQCQP